MGIVGVGVWLGLCMVCGKRVGGLQVFDSKIEFSADTPADTPLE